MRPSLAVAVGQPPDEPEALRTLVEIDRRRGSIGVHIASDVTRPARTSSSVWLDPDRAERLAQDILAAVADWRADEAAIAWTSTGGRRHD
jgi:hypothetical protein